MNYKQTLNNAGMALAIAQEPTATLHTRTQAYIRAATYLGALQAELDASQRQGEIIEQWPDGEFVAPTKRADGSLEQWPDGEFAEGLGR